MDLWTWITTTTSLNDLFATLGLGSLAALFAMDLILTKRQHERRMADVKDFYEKRIMDITAHHQEVAARQDEHYGELKEAHEILQEAYKEEQDRADKALSSAAESVEVVKTTNKFLQAFDETAKEAR